MDLEKLKQNWETFARLVVHPPSFVTWLRAGSDTICLRRAISETPTAFFPASSSSWFRRSWLGRHPEVWIALVLLIASHLFVSTFAKFAHWQFGAPYTRTADLCRWDCTWFRTVVDEGYDLEPYRYGDKADWSFFPLFPLWAKTFKLVLGVPAPLALVVASKVALYAAILFFLLMVRGELEELPEYFLAGGLVAFNPYVLYSHAGYSEPLYFAVAALAFFLVDKNRWIESGIAGALLSATRIVGCLFSISYFIVCLRRVGFGRIIRERNLAIVIGLLLCPLGMALYMLYLYHLTGDAIAFIHIQVAWNRAPGNPFVVIAHALQHHGWPRVWGMMILAGLAAAGSLLKERRPELAVFLAGAILVPLSADLWGFPRYLWWQPPMLYVIFTFLKRHRTWWIIYVAFAAGMASFMVIEWFSGTNMVV